MADSATGRTLQHRTCTEHLRPTIGPGVRYARAGGKAGLHISSRRCGRMADSAPLTSGCAFGLAVPRVAFGSCRHGAAGGLVDVGLATERKAWLAVWSNVAVLPMECACVLAAGARRNTVGGAGPRPDSASRSRLCRRLAGRRNRRARLRAGMSGSLADLRGNLVFIGYRIDGHAWRDPRAPCASLVSLNELDLAPLARTTAFPVKPSHHGECRPATMPCACRCRSAAAARRSTSRHRRR